MLSETRIIQTEKPDAIVVQSSGFSVYELIILYKIIFSEAP